MMEQQTVSSAPVVSAKSLAGRYRPEIRELPVGLIRPGPYQAREQFDEAELHELSLSIREHGLLQPIVVCPSGDGFEVVAGERRLRACRLAGLSTVPALVRSASADERAALSLVENLQRRDLSFFEEAAGYHRLSREFGLTQEEIASRVGKDQSTVANKLRLLRLPESVRQVVARATLSERHARALVRLENEEEQLAVLRHVVEKRLTVTQTERLVDETLAGKSRAGSRQGAFRSIRRGGKVIWVLKDVRLYVNAIRSVVRDLRCAGVDVSYEQEEQPEALSIRILIGLATGRGGASRFDGGGRSEQAPSVLPGQGRKRPSTVAADPKG